MEKRPGIYSLVASITTSIIIVLIFCFLAAGKVSTNPQMYKPIDMYAGMVYVFVLSMIVSASIWPGIIEKKLKG
jgi:hypothetical protein